MLQPSLLLMKSLNKTDSHFLIRSVFFVSKGNLYDVYAIFIICLVALFIYFHDNCFHSFFFFSFSIVALIHLFSPTFFSFLSNNLYLFFLSFSF